ncbi:MAG: hypothetical protein MJ120_04915 [Clostridia bacterium]|nr:hypothetical protein [Clostridia bacterium]
MKSTKQNQKVRLTTEKCDLGNALVGSGQVFNNPVFKIEMKSPAPISKKKIGSFAGRIFGTGFTELVIIAVIVVVMMIMAVKTDKHTFGNIVSFLNHVADFVSIF